MEYQHETSQECPERPVGLTCKVCGGTRQYLEPCGHNAPCDVNNHLRLCSSCHDTGLLLPELANFGIIKESRFKADLFTATKYNSAEDKARFANHFVRFVEKGFPETLFHKWFYNSLSNTFGHIAHLDRRGFYNTFFITDKDKLDFLLWTTEYKPVGDPAWTFKDVEIVLQQWVVDSGLITIYEAKVQKNIEEVERRELARLKAKYECS